MIEGKVFNRGTVFKLFVGLLPDLNHLASSPNRLTFALSQN
jgi:hypothetical protein